MDVVDRVQEAMSVRGLTVAKLCRAAQASEGTVRSVLKRRTAFDPKLSTLQRWAAALGVSVAWLSDGTGGRDAPSR